MEFVTYGITAESNVDFEKVHATVTFTAGDILEVVEVSLIEDDVSELFEEIGGILLNPVGALIKKARATANITPN